MTFSRIPCDTIMSLQIPFGDYVTSTEAYHLKQDVTFRFIWDKEVRILQHRRWTQWPAVWKENAT